MLNAIEIKNLKKKYGQYGVEDVTFNVPTGYIMGFVGKNGAGKTTTIKSILNMIKRDSGEILLFGEDNLLKEASVKKRIGVVMDSPFYEENWTLIQIGKALKPFYKYWDDAKFMEMLNKFQLDPNKTVKGLSRGMKMKIMIACALAHDPDLLILDEPTSGLDAVARDELLEVLRNFVASDNKTVLFSTHITSDLEKIADFIAFINDGKIVHTDTKDNLISKYVVVKGGGKTLSQPQKELIVGFKENSYNYEGIILRESVNQLPKDVVIENCTLDEMVVRFNMGGNF